MIQQIISNAYYKLPIGILCTPYALMNSLSFLVVKFKNIIDLCAPLKTVTIGHRYVIREKWMTKGLLKSSHNLNKLRSKISKNNNNVSINDYKIYRNLYNRLIRIAKATHYSEQIEQHRVIYQKHGKF